MTFADVAQAAGVDEPAIEVLFRSRRDLELQVVEKLAASAVVPDVWTVRLEPEHFASVLAARRADRIGTRLRVRCALGDLDVTPLLDSGNAWTGLVRGLEIKRGRRRGAVPLRTRLCAFGALSMLLGWMSYESFLVAGLALDDVGAEALDAAVAGHVAFIADLALEQSPALPTGRQSPSRSHLAVSDEIAVESADSELARRSIDEFTERVSDLFEGDEWFDLPDIIRFVRHSSPVARRLARAMVADVPVDAYRGEFPVLSAILATYTKWTGLEPLDGGGDRRIAVGAGLAMVLGSALWDRALRAAVGIADDVDCDPAIITFARIVAGFDDPTKPLDRG